MKPSKHESSGNGRHSSDDNRIDGSDDSKRTMGDRLISAIKAGNVMIAQSRIPCSHRSWIEILIEHRRGMLQQKAAVL
jgi:hypothetical protein